MALKESHAARGRAADLRVDRAHGLGDPVGGHVQATEHAVAVQHREEVEAFGRVDDPALDAPRGQPAMPAV